MHHQPVSQTTIRQQANDGNTESLYSWDSHDAHCKMQVTPDNHGRPKTSLRGLTDVQHRSPHMQYMGQAW